MVKLDKIEATAVAYEKEPEEGDNEVDVGLQIKMDYKGIAVTDEVPYANALYLMRKLPKNDPLKKEMFDALKTLPRE